MVPRITPNLWFDTESMEAGEFYVSVFPNSRIRNISYYNEADPRPAGEVLAVDFVLDGQEFTAINGGPQFRFSEAISLLIKYAASECNGCSTLPHRSQANRSPGYQPSGRTR